MPARFFARRSSLLAACALVVALSARIAAAEVIDVSLNVLYTDPQNAAGGGTWVVVAKSDGSGIAGLKVLLTGISNAQNIAPRGFVNGTDPAGFGVISNSFNPIGFNEVNIFQAPIASHQLDPGEEQSVFYGVGTLANGAPGAIGPTFTSLTSVTGSPWGTGDILGDPAWNTAVRFAAGTFATGAAAPGFFQAGAFESRGTTFTSVGTSMNSGDISDSILLNTIVRTNLVRTADYNGNGVVDAADFVLWRNTLGSTTMLQADGDNSGTIDAGDYDFWRANFGTVFGAGAGALAGAAQVPEPASIWLLLGSVLLAARRVPCSRPGTMRSMVGGASMFDRGSGPSFGH